MSLGEALAREQDRPTPGQCKVCQLLSVLPLEDADALGRALAADSGYQTAQIVRAAASEGHSLSESSVRRHRARCV